MYWRQNSYETWLGLSGLKRKKFTSLSSTDVWEIILLYLYRCEKNDCFNWCIQCVCVGGGQIFVHVQIFNFHSSNPPSDFCVTVNNIFHILYKFSHHLLQNRSLGNILVLLPCLNSTVKVLVCKFIQYYMWFCLNFIHSLNSNHVRELLVCLATVITEEFNFFFFSHFHWDFLRIVNDL